MPKAQELTVDDHDKPLAERRFPFRAVSDKQGRELGWGAEKIAAERAAANTAIEVVLAKCNDMFFSAVRKQLNGKATETQIQDAIQDLRIHIALHTLPRYDITKKNPRTGKLTLVSTFVFTACRNQATHSKRGILRERHSPRRKRFVSSEAAEVAFANRIGDEGINLDAKIESVADYVRAHPERFLTKAQAIAFRAFLDNPGIQMKVLAVKLGYRRASSFSMMMRRIFERIREIDVLDIDLAEGEGEST